MAKLSKTSVKERLFALLDIAESIRRELGDVQALSFYDELRGLAQEHSTVAAVRALERDFLVEWNEGVGAEVEAFWQKVADAGIALERRRDVVVETLDRGRVASMDDFCALEDAFEALQRCGKVSPEQAERLNVLLDAFANDPRHEAQFEPRPAPLKG